MAVQTQGPNLFEFVHEDTKITYSTGERGDDPRLVYHGPMGRHTFSGDEIEARESARGLEVSVTLDRVSHLRTITLTAEPMEFDGLARIIEFRAAEAPQLL